MEGLNIRRGLPTEGNLLFQIDCFCFVLVSICGQFSKYKLPDSVYWRGDLTEVFLRYRFGRLIFGGAYIWRGLFSEVYGILRTGLLSLSEK